MKIAILEKTNFNENQMEKLKKMGEVFTYDGLSQEEANEIAPNFDVVIVNWLDPTPFLLKMKKGSLIALLSTGYGWISNIKEAYKKGIYVANIPNYSTEAVAEHLLGLLLGVTKNIFPTLNSKINSEVGIELSNKTIGIIGLGNIGTRFAEIMHFFNAKIITNNRTIKNNSYAKDVDLETLLSQSDIICITCSVNGTSKNLININNYKKLKKGVILIGSTWEIVSEEAMKKGLEENIIKFISFDAAIEGNNKVFDIAQEHSKKVFFTPHNAYNTIESEERQLNICVDNIFSFVNGIHKNVVH